MHSWANTGPCITHPNSRHSRATVTAPALFISRAVILCVLLFVVEFRWIRSFPFLPWLFSFFLSLSLSLDRSLFASGCTNDARLVFVPVWLSLPWCYTLRRDAAPRQRENRRIWFACPAQKTTQRISTQRTVCSFVCLSFCLNQCAVMAMTWRTRGCSQRRCLMNLSINQPTNQPTKQDATVAIFLFVPFPSFPNHRHFLK